MATAGGGRSPDGAAGGYAARRAASRRCALRPRAVAAVRRRCALVCLLDRLAARDANAVPGGTRARDRVAPDAPRGGVPLPVEPALLAHVRLPVRAGELPRARRAPRGRDHRQAAGAVGRTGGRPRRLVRCVPAPGVVPVVLRPPRASRAERPRPGALDVGGVRRVRRMAERLRADRCAPADGAGDSVHRLGRPRLPNRDDPRPVARARRGRVGHDRVADRAARPAARRRSSRRHVAASRDRRFRGLGRDARGVGDVEPGDSRGAKPCRARHAGRIGAFAVVGSSYVQAVVPLSPNVLPATGTNCQS